MKKVFILLSIIFAILCFSWAGYVLYTDGKANPGLGIISMVAALCCIQIYNSMLDVEKKKIVSSGNKVTGIITDIKKYRWIKINKKFIRTHSSDGAFFPHIIYFTYTVGNTNFKGKKYINCQTISHSINTEIEVYYDCNNPKICTIK